jgi:hypothetical protein
MLRPAAAASSKHLSRPQGVTGEQRKVRRPHPVPGRRGRDNAVVADFLRDVLRLGKTSTAPLELLMVSASFYRTYSIDYHGGERHPVLERDPSQPDLLTLILEPLVRRP